MKKSTLILIAIFGITILFFFFAPIIFYKPISPEDWSAKELTVTISTEGDSTDITLSNFNKVKLDLSEAERYYYPYIQITDERGNGVRLQLAIQEMEGLESPRMLVTTGWMKVLKINELDSVLSIGIDTEGLMPLTAEEEEGEAYYSRYLNIVVPYGCREIGTLQVPPGMLSNVSGSGGNILLRDFKNAELNVAIDYIDVEAENCSFKQYTVYQGD